MTARWIKKGAAFVLTAALLGACSDDSNPPPPDGGKGDGPQVQKDGQVPTEGGLPPGDGYVSNDSTAPTSLTAHMDEACSTGLYQINVAPGKETSTCANIQTLGITYLQVTIGDNESGPPPAGRTYTVKDLSQVTIYPADGEATAVYSSTGGVQSVKSGSFTVNPYTKGAKVFSGSFNVTLGDGTKVQSQYLSDFCPFDPTSCD